jgi:polysaccharide deacetylase 2 family uncharacterized protein YibQ
MKNKTHNKLVLDYLKRGKKLTQRKANRMGISHLPNTIRHLRNLGYNIKTDMVNARNMWFQKVRYGVYTLEAL